jgi:hypothetical protein
MTRNDKEAWGVRMRIGGAVLIAVGAFTDWRGIIIGLALMVASLAVEFRRDE